MAKRWLIRSILLFGAAVLLAGLGYRIRLMADQPDDESTPPKVTAAAVRSPLPEDYPVNDVEMFAKTMVHRTDAPYEVWEFHGSFKLDFAKRRISADNGVVWVKVEKIGEKELNHFTVYLDGAVRINEIGGTTMTAKRQIVTFETTGRLWAFPDETQEPTGESPFYHQAVAFRERAASTTQAAIESEPVTSRPDTALLVPLPRPPIVYKADRSTMLVRGNERLLLGDGHVYISRPELSRGGEQRAIGRTNAGHFLEIQADRAVVYAKESKIQQSMSRATSAPDMPEVIEGAYLEGAVLLRQGERTIEAERLYYDFEQERALILDAVMFQPHPTRKVPMIVWADQIRQLSGVPAGKPGPGQELGEQEMVAYNARLTTSEMNTPQFDLKAKEIYLKVQEKADQNNQIYYQTKDEQLEIRGEPVTWSPGSKGTLDQEETALRRVRTGSITGRGNYLEADWNLYKLLNQPTTPGVDATLGTAYYSKAGPDLALNAKWAQDDRRGYGLAEGFLDKHWSPPASINQDPDLQPQGTSTTTSNQNNGFQARERLLLRDQEYLKNDWELIGEFDYMSDRDLLYDWYKNEFDTGKEQETLLYLKKSWDDNAFTVLVKPKIDAFLNQAEKLPEIKYYKLGESLWSDRLTFFSENSAALAEYSPDNLRLDEKDSGLLSRVDTRQEFRMPLQSGPVKIVPYAVVRLTDWSQGSTAMFPNGLPQEPSTSSSSATSAAGGNGTLRAFAAGGVNVSTTFSRTYDDVESRFWDVHRLRSIIEPTLNVHLAEDNVARDKLLPLDPGVEGINGTSVVNIGGVYRLETKRGGPDEWRSVDWMRLDLFASLFFGNKPTRTWFEPEFTRLPGLAATQFNASQVFARGEFDPTRPEDSLAMSSFNARYEWRLSDSTTLLSDASIGSGGLDYADFGVSIQRTPRWRMYFGDYYIKALNSNVLQFQSDYKIDRKYDMIFGIGYDTINSQVANVELSLVRKSQRMYVAVSFQLSNLLTPQTQSTTGSTGRTQMVMLTIWPEGGKELTLGQRSLSTPGTTTSSVQGVTP